MTSRLSDDRLGYFARIFTALFREHERSVALIIAKARIGRGAHFARQREASRR